MKFGHVFCDRSSFKFFLDNTNGINKAKYEKRSSSFDKNRKEKRTFAKAYVHTCILEVLRFWEYKGNL